MAYFLMTPENSSVQIVCTNLSHMVFNGSQHILITNLEFIGCGNNMVENVEEFVVLNTKFKGEDNSGTALQLVNTTAQIVNSTFVSNKGKFSENIKLATTITVSASIGGAIIAIQSNINYSQSTFIGNSAYIGGVIFVGQNSIIDLNSCFFINNTADKGGVLYSDSSTVTIKVSEFFNNTANYGGVLYSRGSSNITIQASEFDNNIATEKGGVLHSSASIITTVSERMCTSAEILFVQYYNYRYLIARDIALWSWNIF